ncbi:MAG: hypothetical protein U0175_01720 [Caldilineaceae bacterium]
MTKLSERKTYDTHAIRLNPIHLLLFLYSAEAVAFISGATTPMGMVFALSMKSSLLPLTA